MMKKIIGKLLICFLALGMQSCVKDLQDDINGGGWNHEHSIISIGFENQIGSATIDNIDSKTGEIELSINVGAQPSMSSVKLTSMELSYQATSSAQVGDVLDFSSGESSISVTSTTGETRTYNIKANSFKEEIEGVWKISDLTVYGGTGPEYGGGAVMQLASKPWCWYDEKSPEKECDNTLTFKLTGVTEAGNPTGTCYNDAGQDGAYADFIFQASMNKEGDTDIDLNKFYRQIPKGESTWERDYTAGTITFTDSKGNKTTGSFVDKGSIDVGYGKNFTVADHAFQFSLNGVDDWTNIYSDYDKFVKKPRIYWISVTKDGE